VPVCCPAEKGWFHSLLQNTNTSSTTGGCEELRGPSRSLPRQSGISVAKESSSILSRLDSEEDLKRKELVPHPTSSTVEQLSIGHTAF